MLTLVLGRAGSGKTSYIYRELANKSAACQGGSILIVPEQYSHDAERALAAACGDKGCLYAEVLSFSRLCSRVFAQTGGLADRMLDNGGRMLAMSLALIRSSQHLRVYNIGSSRRPDFLRELIDAYDELRSSGTTANKLALISDQEEGVFRNKLSDLSVIFDEYDAIKEASGCDVRDKMEKLAKNIGDSDIGDKGTVYVDGFTDFTGQELRVIRELMKKGADITVSLTCPGLYDTETAFSITRKTARRLMTMASREGTKASILEMGAPSGKADELLFLEKHLFDHSEVKYDGDKGHVNIRSADGVYGECAFAASRVLEFLRGGSRMRDIAVVSPVWDEYEPLMREVFNDYGLVLGVTDKRDILEIPAVSHVVSALQVIDGGWRYSDVFKYLKTGMPEISLDDRDILENYVLEWNIRGRTNWTREQGWDMHPGGYTEKMDDDESQALARINKLRVTVATPISKLEDELHDAATAIGKVRAVYEFMEYTGLYGAIQKRVGELKNAGELELAGEYDQLWDMMTGALGQFADILGETAVETSEFIKLFKLVLSQYKVGVIPAYVDSVRAGDMSRIRARGIRHLIVVGARDDAIPGNGNTSGVFTDQERDRLRKNGVELIDSDDDILSRELGEVYASFTVPSDTLDLSYPAGERASYVLTRIRKILDIRETHAGEEAAFSAKIPFFEFSAGRGGNVAGDALKYFELLPEWRGKLAAVREAASMPRGRLAKIVAKSLYGDELRVSASRVEKYYSCRFSYFIQYGLRAKPRKQAAMDSLESGTFFHFVLERAVRRIEDAGGFGSVSKRDVKSIVLESVDEYVVKRLGGIQNKSGRFRYLFDRLVKDVMTVVLNMVDELKNSEFKPMDFELRFAVDGDLPPIEINGEGVSISVSGAVDRVDGWYDEYKLYLRVVDYKSSRRTFSLSDVWYGMGLQMLIYLFALQREGKERYGLPVVPAGVLYTPVRDTILRASRDLDDSELERLRSQKIGKSGLLLNDKTVLEAMDKAFGAGMLPVRISKSGEPIGDSLASLEQLGKLAKKVDSLIEYMGQELLEGSISADPYYKSQIDNACVYCDYFDACRFNGNSEEDKPRYIKNMGSKEAWTRIQEVK